MAGFLLFRDRTLHRTAFDYSAKGLTLRASAKALFNTAPAPVVRVRSPYLEEPAYGWVFAFQRQDSPSNCVRFFGQRPHPAGQRHRTNAPFSACIPQERWLQGQPDYRILGIRRESGDVRRAMSNFVEADTHSLVKNATSYNVQQRQ